MGVLVDRRRGGGVCSDRAVVWDGLSDVEKERVRYVVDRVVSGEGVDVVAAELGLSVQVVEQLLRMGLDGLVGRLSDYIEDRVRLQLLRLDRLFHAVYPAALGGEVGAVKRALEILQREAALLGLDAAQKRVVEHRLTVSEQAARQIFGSDGLPEWYVDAEYRVVETDGVDEGGESG